MRATTNVFNRYAPIKEEIDVKISKQIYKTRG